MSRAAALLAALALLAACDRRPPELYQFPDGFKGWVVVEYERPDCERLPRESGWLVYRVPQEGRLCTRDAFPQGSAEDRYEYASPDGTGKPLSFPDQVRQIEYEALSHKHLLFVGTRQEQEKAKAARPSPFR